MKKFALENRTARLANLLSTTEKAGKKDVPALELKLEFENIPADDLLPLLGPVKLKDFKEALWEKNGDPLFSNLGDHKIERLDEKNAYRLVAFGETNNVKLLKDFSFHPTSGHRCRLTCVTRVLDYGKSFCWQANQRQRQDVDEISLTPLSEELDL